MKKVSNIVSKAFIIMGCLAIITATYMKFSTEVNRQEMITEYKEYQEELNIIEKNEDKQEEPKPEVKILKTGDTIGIINIPKIELEVAVCEGIDDKILKYAIGHFEETSLPGEPGNFAVIGHRNYTFGEYFNRLDELENGDLVTIEYGAKTYSYKITDKFVVEPEELWVLDPTKDPTITLITCTPKRVATHRLIVKGILVQNSS